MIFPISVAKRPEDETLGRTNTDSEGKYRRSCYDVFDEVRLAGTDEGGGLPIILVVVRRSRYTAIVIRGRRVQQVDTATHSGILGKLSSAIAASIHISRLCL